MSTDSDMDYDTLIGDLTFDSDYVSPKAGKCAANAIDKLRAQVAALEMRAISLSEQVIELQGSCEYKQERIAELEAENEELSRELAAEQVFGLDLARRFASGNDVPVERTTITRPQYEAMKEVTADAQRMGLYGEDEQ